MSVAVTTLQSGIQVVTDTMSHLESASLGVWVHSGSRDERKDEHGISHFLEHMAFKGTRRRSARQIAEEIEAVGGDLNAATSVESGAGRGFHRLRYVVNGDACGFGGDRGLNQRDHAGVAGVLSGRLKHDVDAEIYAGLLGSVLLGDPERIGQTRRDDVERRLVRGHSGRADKPGDAESRGGQAGKKIPPVRRVALQACQRPPWGVPFVAHVTRASL